ncbi:MAG: hypothetical protein ABW252_22145 [Polyangiales bacterium]
MPKEMALGLATIDTLRCIVWLHGEHDIPPDDWVYAMERVRAAKTACAGDATRLRFLVVTDGGAPNAQQRTELFASLLEGRVRCAAVSNSLDNPIKRGIVTAITWLNRDFKAVLPEQFESALAHLGIAQNEPIWRVLTALQATVPLNRSLVRVATVLGHELAASASKSTLTKQAG